MSATRHPISPYVPLLLSLALVAGLFLGRNLGDGSGGPLTIFQLRQPAAADKLGQVLDLIDRQYVDSVEKGALVEEVLQEMLHRLDPHSYYISAAELRAATEPLEGSFDGIGVEFAIQRDTVVVVSPVEGGPSAQLGIRAGDRILKADTVPLAGVGITNDGVMKLLRGPKGSQVKVVIGRPGKKPMDVEITRGAIPINSVAAALLRPDGTGYIKLSRFAKNTHAEFLAAADGLRAEGMQRLVLDLRGNGGGYLNAAVDLADEFLPDGSVIVYTQGRRSPRRDMLATGRGVYENIPLAILIDEGSASASEIIAGALQDNDRATIVGRRSFGKGLVQEHIDLPDQSAVRITTARYYTASGRSIQKPYGAGVDYDADYERRTTHGELFSADSVRIDSTQVFRTKGGRIVYGGGGVMPDLFVAADTAEGSQFLTDLFFSGTLNQYAFDLADRERGRLLAFGSPSAFKLRYALSETALEGLRKEAKEQGIIEKPGELERSRKQITNRLKAGVARNLWGDPGFYEVMLDSDSAFIRAADELAAGKAAGQK
ncbi:MAG: S41 family peptidase [Flavobacteriales bacterium]|nr:S41 family peptidase [Flavobacteriales bacterium]